MARKQQSKTTFHWNQSSSDIKPSSGVTEGSTVHYIDTGEEFIYHNGMWEPDRRRSSPITFEKDYLT